MLKDLCYNKVYIYLLILLYTIALSAKYRENKKENRKEHHFMRIELPKNNKKETYIDRTQLTLKDIKGFRKKVQYIWEYYHIIFFTVIMCAVLIGGVAISVYKNIKYKTIFYCVIINNHLTEETQDALTQDFSAYLNLNKENELLTVDNSLVIDYEENSPQQENTYYSVEKLTALFASRTVDCFITDGTVTEAYAKTAGFHDLNQLLPQDMLNALSDRLVTFTAYANEDAPGVEGAYSIDITGTEFAEKYGIYLDKAYLSIVINSEHTDSAIAFIRFVFGL